MKRSCLILAAAFIASICFADETGESIEALEEVVETVSEEVSENEAGSDFPIPEEDYEYDDDDSDSHDEDSSGSKKNSGSKEKNKSPKYAKKKETPSARRPKKGESKNYSDKSDTYVQDCNDTFKYGLQEQINKLIDEVTKNEDTRFVDQIYDLFNETKDPAVRNKILSYFTKLKDPCLGDYACEIINDPYDERKDTVAACFRYVSEAKIEEAVPGLVDLVDKEEDDYFSGALAALGELGGKDEAVFLADYIERDDLSVPQKQSLMKVLGRIKAVETYDKLAEIAQNEDENSFVRMYAAESIGAMQVKEAEEILVKLFESDDPNLRCYVIKGISHFDDETSEKVIIQGLRDSQYKVRLEAIDAAGEKKLKSAVPFLVYRCKDKEEQKAVKEKCYSVLAKMDTSEGNDYLVSIIEDKKAADSTKSKVASVLLEENHAGTKEIIELARTSLSKETQKNLRYSLGKEFAKYERSEFADICLEYLESEDVMTQGTGLDIWAKGRYSKCRSKVEEIAQDAMEAESDEPEEKPKTYQFGKKKKNANSTKARKILERTGGLSSSGANDK